MLTFEKLLGGGVSVAAASYSVPRFRAKLVRNANTSSDSTWTLAEPANLSAGGPIHVIDNSATTNTVTVQRSDSTSIGTVPASSVAYVFLLDGSANSGAGDWALAGAGTGGTGGQGPTEVGYNYGTATAPTGVDCDLGDAENLLANPQNEIDFNNAFVLAPPPI